MDLCDLFLPQQVAPEPEQARQSSVPDALMAGCPSDLKAILSCFLGSLDISEPDRLLERVLCEQHPRALLTELFPGRVQGVPIASRVR